MIRPSATYRVGRSRTGLGLFAVAAFRRGDFIVEYLGERIPSAQSRGHPRERYHFEINSRWTLDGSARWNIARYINHSCKPNAEAWESRGRIRIKARRRIAPGEEITFDYGKRYVDLFIAPAGCRCAACAPAEPTSRRAFSRRDW